MANIIFSMGSDEPADLINNAASVVRLLAETLPALADQKEYLSEHAANGLYIVLTGVEETLKQAITIA